MGMSDPPDDQSPQDTSSSKDGALKSLVGVQSLIQLGLLLPACVVIGWAIGLALDHWLNLHWMNIVGLIAGAIAGFIQTVRVAMSHNKD
jgi:F0F1-type ATP synthase assembly protein I